MFKKGFNIGMGITASLLLVSGAFIGIVAYSERVREGIVSRYVNVVNAISSRLMKSMDEIKD